MSSISGNLEIKGLARRQVIQLNQRAIQLGMTTERYLKHLVEEDLAVTQQAKTMTFAELMESSREVDESELDRVVEKVRTQYHRRYLRKR